MLNNTTVKAVAAKVKIGGIELDGYQMPNGVNKMSRNGLEALDILLGDSTGKKYAKPILEADKSQGELTKIEGNNASAKLMSLETFSAIVAEYAKLGNSKCQALVFACFAESLERRLDAAFGVKRSEEEHESLTKARYAGKQTRRSLTDAIKWYVENHDVSSNYKKFIYSNVSDVLNRYVLGCSSKQAMKLLGLSGTSVLRDGLEAQVVKALDVAELVAMQCIDIKDMEPMQAIKEALTFTRQFHLV